MKQKTAPFLLAVSALLAASLACGRSAATEQPSDSLVTTTVGGLERTYELYVPAGIAADEEVPLVFVFHGYGGNAQAARLISGFNRLADNNHFIVVYPNGTGESQDTLSWNGGRCCFYARDNNIDDVGFVRQAVEEIEAQYSIDAQRIYATGMSNGGIFSYRLACEMADTFAAVAPVAGSFLFEACQPSEPVSILHIHGLDDDVVPYDGVNLIPELAGVDFTPIEEGVAFWAGQDECPPAPEMSQDGNVMHIVYAPCADETAVELYALDGVGHTWPFVELQSSRVIWEFFTAHPKP
ncbi:MAG: prolyl oligopeptidase family serine peptidase [Chloroflexi bacterium]|nr:prolyl oligopeptidase family serine peptidase [Chloroflexota bacterium]